LGSIRVGDIYVEAPSNDSEDVRHLFQCIGIWMFDLPAVPGEDRVVLARLVEEL
jgi:hypothetical protein